MFFGNADCLVSLYSLGTLQCFGNVISSDLVTALFDPFVKILWHASNPYPIHFSHTSPILSLCLSLPLPFTLQLTTLGVCVYWTQLTLIAIVLPPSFLLWTYSAFSLKLHQSVSSCNKTCICSLCMMECEVFLCSELCTMNFCLSCVSEVACRSQPGVLYSSMWSVLGTHLFKNSVLLSVGFSTINSTLEESPHKLIFTLLSKA